MSEMQSTRDKYNQFYQSIRYVNLNDIDAVENIASVYSWGFVYLAEELVKHNNKDEVRAVIHRLKTLKAVLASKNNEYSFTFNQMIEAIVESQAQSNQQVMHKFIQKKRQPHPNVPQVLYNQDDLEESKYQSIVMDLQWQKQIGKNRQQQSSQQQKIKSGKTTRDLKKKQNKLDSIKNNPNQQQDSQVQEPTETLVEKQFNKLTKSQGNSIFRKDIDSFFSNFVDWYLMGFSLGLSLYSNLKEKDEKNKFIYLFVIPISLPFVMHLLFLFLCRISMCRIFQRPRKWIINKMLRKKIEKEIQIKKQKEQKERTEERIKNQLIKKQRIKNWRLEARTIDSKESISVEPKRKGNKKTKTQKNE